MLRTILLLDGSAVMNSAADYLPSYCLALRTPILQCVAEYLDGTPLATMGVVVMRDGVCRRIAPCTSNSTEIAESLEREYFLVGGSGVLSLENGLRMAMSEMVDLRKVRANGGNTTSHDPTRLRILLISASVTLIDPTDVFAVIKLMAQLHVELHCVSLCGAVHVFEEAARMTGGTMHCPLNYGHLQRIMHQLALELAVEGRGRRRRRVERGRGKQATTTAKDDTDTRKRARDAHDGEAAEMIPIGFPVCANADANTLASSSSSSSPAQKEVYLICPQCHLIQTAIPTTCRMCRLQLCSVPILYSSFVRHSQYALLPPTAAAKTRSTESGARTKPTVRRCSTCHCVLSTSATKMTSQEVDALDSESGSGGGSRDPVQCTACESWRCAACDVYVREHLGLCPTCLA